ncbi:MAG: flagellar hook protein FlgE [Gammaproteobacteria bacterium]|nr:flagellar hook protein FlgE [Gammaproteobacteria bacterium]TVQ49063.1 MAG: flagellar hook protein FlgE [Gammaproteobacteria bacterium]
MPFRTALSGLNAASADLRVTGNNIANSGTTGFKGSRAEFADIFATAYGGVGRTAIGTGVRLSSVTQQFSQGNIDFTGSNLDMALSGRGFFVLDDGGARSYTRDGSFQVDRDGFVVNSGGKRLQSYPLQDRLSGTFNTGQLQDLRLATTESSPGATSRVEASFNLRATAEDLSEIDFDADDPNSYSFSTSLTVYDSLGQSHVATVFFRNVGNLEWEANLAIDGQPVGDAQSLTFAADGSLAAPQDPLQFGAFTPTNGAAPLDIEFDVSRATQFGASDSVSSLRQDGFASGRLTGIDIDDSGVVFARYTNGQSAPLGQVAVASFANPQGLQQVGDNAWVETFAAGDPILGTAGSGDLGTLQSGGLEASNIDIAAELVNLITAQRNFQANAQVISTADTVTQTIINIR